MVAYLIASGLVSEAATDEGRVSVVDLSARNRSFSVRTRGGQSFFVKQAAFIADLPALAHEAAVYEHLEQVATPAARRPRLHVYDEPAGIVVVDLVPGAESLHELHRRPGSVTPALATQLAHALADLHETQAPELPGRALWALSAPRPSIDALRELGPADLELLKTLQGEPSLCAGLEGLRREWRPDGFAHGDVRWANVLVSPETPGRVQVVDWECAGAGDCRADLGAALGEFLWAWLDSMRVGGPLDPASSLASATLPLDAIRPAVASFWAGYIERRRIRPPAERVLLTDAIRFAAARVVEGAFERSAEAALLQARPVLALQLATNMFDEPDAAGRDLLGLTVTHR